MGFKQEFVVEKILESNFEVIDMEQEENGTLRIKIVHDIHPDIEVLVSVINSDEGAEDSMVLQFDGPDDYTDDEAKQVLQDVMDLLVYIVEKAVEEEPTPVEEQDSSEEENNGDN